MQPEQLGESTLNPDSKYGRTLVRYNFENAKAEIERAQYLDKNKDEFIRNAKVSRIDMMD